MKRLLSLALALALILALAGCGAGTAAPTPPETTPAPSPEPTAEPSESTSSAVTSEPVQTGLFAEQILSGADGNIHYSYYLPESYDGNRKFPMMVVMPGYDMMWFGEDSSGSNLNPGMPPSATKKSRQLSYSNYAVSPGWLAAFFDSPGFFAFGSPPPGENRIFLCLRISSERSICAFLFTDGTLAPSFSSGCRSPPLISICLSETNKSKLEEIK